MTLLNRDFKTATASPSTTRRRNRHWQILAVLTGLVGGATLVGPINFAQATRNSQLHAPGEVLTSSVTLPLQLPAKVKRDGGVAAHHAVLADWKEVVVRSGDTLSGLFQRMDIDNQQLYALLAADKKAGKIVQRLRPGQVLKYQQENGRLQGLQLALNNTETLTYSRDGEDFKADFQQVKLESRIKHATGHIQSSLYEAGLRADLPDSIIMEIVSIFGWDVDFALDIRSGDSFNVIYEEFYKDGEKLEDGHILAAEFVNQGHTFRAVHYTAPDGESNFFTPEGYSMRKAFIRSPVDFRRISSTFQTERYHPVLGKKRPHRGVDYAAAIGTPIKAAGDGKVIFRGTKGGYGNTVIIQHGGKYTTLYAHMSKYRSGVGVGTRVKQGQIIGYVGQSGLATGPHLHYEFRIDGVHRNPLTVKLPNAEPIRKEFKQDFALNTQPLIAQLDVYRQIQLAASQ